MRQVSITTPRKLAECAFSLFAERGIHSITMDDIAAKAEVTKGSVYWHFKSKQEITEAAAAHYYQSWYLDVNRRLARFANPLDRLKAVVGFSVRSCLLDEKNRVFTLEILTYSLYDRAMRNSWAQFYAGVREFYIALIEAARAEGQVRTRSSRQAADMLLVAMEGIKQRALFEPHICDKAGEKTLCESLMRIVEEF